MKLKNLNRTNHKLIKLELLKSKFLKTGSLKKNVKEEIYNFALHVKKLLLIVYKYHLNNKKILFFGISKDLFTKHKNLFKNSTHLFFPEFYWKKGLLVNKKNVFKYLKKKINSPSNKDNSLNVKITSYFLIKKKPDLIVILNESDRNNSLLDEANKLKIPLVNFNVTNSQNKKRKDSFFFSLIYSILKRKIKFNVKKETIQT